MNLNPGSKGTNPRNVLLSWAGHAMHERMEAEAALFSRAIKLFVNTTPLVSTPVPDESPHVQGKRSRARNGSTEATNGENLSIRSGNQTRRNAGPSGQNENRATQNGNTPGQYGSRVVQNALPVRPNGSSPVQAELSRYVSLLHEKAAFLGETPVWEETNIGTLESPCFKCQVTFKGKTAKGTGKQKRLAKSEASYRICQMLDYQLS